MPCARANRSSAPRSRRWAQAQAPCPAGWVPRRKPTPRSPRSGDMKEEAGSFVAPAGEVQSVSDGPMSAAGIPASPSCADVLPHGEACCWSVTGPVLAGKKCRREAAPVPPRGNETSAPPEVSRARNNVRRTALSGTSSRRGRAPSATHRTPSRGGWCADGNPRTSSRAGRGGVGSPRTSSRSGQGAVGNRRHPFHAPRRRPLFPTAPLPRDAAARCPPGGISPRPGALGHRTTLVVRSTGTMVPSGPADAAASGVLSDPYPRDASPRGGGRPATSPTASS
ncbi:Hypothetical protein CAP_1347 [Chondromyces apiculatus DSM 436]|uniref:Uncharacterized protein n=1 Tax=Chondromyces apiculatus DSM 436 TaxID=1192034 RepID=A0A017SU61_9BACT|nr:Hypothetical protein CAP_1347 [Chondromyces apiculatus DSM 436]